MAKIGLVLSGGGIFGLAHIGVLKVIDRLGIKISAIAGCSMGSIVGAAYCAGKSPEEMEEFILSMRPHNLVNFSLSKLGIKKMGRFENSLIDFLGEKDFSKLQLPLYINATNITEGKERVFSSGSIMNAIKTSTAYPGIFAPIKIKNNYYIDGGVTNNLPFPILPKNIKKFVAVNVAPKKILYPHDKATILTVLDISLRMMQDEITYLKLNSYKDKNYTIIKPHFTNKRIITPEKYFRYLVNAGEIAAQNHIPELKKKFKI